MAALLDMSRDLRFLPHPHATVEITQRTLQGRALLRPSKQLNLLVVGCLARAQKKTGALVHAVAVLSNHFHLLATFETVEQMSRFMGHLNTNLSKEVGTLHDWQGPLFAGRYHSIPLSREPAAQVERLRYILGQGTKEGLVASPRDWPGVHSAKALATDEPLQGVWVDRTKLYAARRKDRKARASDFSRDQALTLAPLPCWADLEAAERCRLVAALVEEIESETRARHEMAGTQPVGASQIRRRHPPHRTRIAQRRPKPRFHAVTRAARDALLEAYRHFLIAYRTAADRLASGEVGVSFPGGSWPSRLPFVEPSWS